MVRDGLPQTGLTENIVEGERVSVYWGKADGFEARSVESLMNLSLSSYKTTTFEELQERGLT